jgi:hypothetical protein
MQLADRHHAVASVPQAVVPARNLAVVRIGVVPVADLVDVLAGGEGGARRHADRAGGVRVGEAQAARRQAVEVRRVHHPVSRAAHPARVVLVGHDDEQVCGFHF